MPDSVKICREIGRSFESKVASKLRAIGFEVYTNLYVPYRPGWKITTEIDIVAIRNGEVLTCECKGWQGSLIGEYGDKTWSWDKNGEITTVGNPFRQSWSHRAALEENLNVKVPDIIVISNGLQWNCSEDGRVVRYANVEAMVEAVMSRLPEQPPVDLLLARSLIRTWSTPDGATIQRQILQTISAKNNEAVSALEQHIGTYCYCVLLPDGHFYCYTDDEGHVWGAENLKEVAIFQHLSDAYDVADDFEGAEVCTFELGYIEAVSDLPDEMDDLTPDEFAYEVGARLY